MSSMDCASDARVPVIVGGDGHGAAALLPPDGVAPDGVVAMERVAAAVWHPRACGCCAGRSPAAMALDRLFQARARGRVPWFDRVVVAPELAEATLSALQEDVLCSARFRPPPG